MRRSIVKCIGLIMSMALTGICILGNCTGTYAASKGKKIVMNKTSLNIVKGNTFKLKVKKVKPAKLGKAVTYKSKKKAIATVTKKGIVKAVNEGKTKIIVTLKSDKKVKMTVNVKVHEKNSINNVPNSQGNDNKTGITPAPVFSPSPLPEPTPSYIPPSPSPETELFGNTPQMYFDIISNQFTSMITDGVIDVVAVDMSACSSMSDSDKQSLISLIEGKYDKTVMQKTQKELEDEGSIVEDSTYGKLFKNGALITITETDNEPDNISFGITCYRNGLYVSGYINCKAKHSDKWSYELGSKITA